MPVINDITRADSYLVAFEDRKLELIDGNVIVCNDLGLSRLTLQSLLITGGLGELARDVPADLLQQAIRERGDGPAEVVSVSCEVDHQHRNAVHHLGMGAFVCLRQGLQTGGRDLVVRLGNDALTPDLYVARPDSDGMQGPNFFDGCPELIIEVEHEGHEEADRVGKRELYEAAGVPEFWCVNPVSREARRWVNGDHEFSERPVLSGGLLECGAIPGLALDLDQLFAGAEDYEADFDNLWRWKGEGERIGLPSREIEQVGWDSLSYAPRWSLEPEPVSFDEFMSWCGEAKFEWMGSRPAIGGGEDTTRRLTGLLVMTFGLREALRLAPEEKIGECRISL